MAGNFLDYAFDEELFINSWGEYPDLTTRALLNCGVLANSPQVTAQLQNGGNYFTTPFYKPLEGTPVNYDGQTDILVNETTAGSQSGVAFGRAIAWGDRDFMYDITSADPMGSIVRKVGTYWQNDRQARLVKILEAVLANADMATHTATVAEDDILGNLLEQLATVFGQNRNQVRALVMDSLTAVKYEKIGLLEFRKYNDANGVERNANIADLLGFTVVVDDTAMADKAGTIYALGAGAIITAEPKVKVPVELERDAKKNGGETHLITRVRDVLHPNGFTVTKPSSTDVSPTDEFLADSTNYALELPEKSIIIAKFTIGATDVTP